RRHTRLVSDWSSDVCSSDLLCCTTLAPANTCKPQRSLPSGWSHTSIEWFSATPRRQRSSPEQIGKFGAASQPYTHNGRFHGQSRSEERRVGKECRSRRSPDQ